MGMILLKSYNHPNSNGLLYDKINKIYIQFFDYKQKSYKGYNYSHPISLSMGHKPVSIKNEIIQVINYKKEITNNITIYTIIDFVIINVSELNAKDPFEYSVFYNLDNLKVNDNIYFIQNNVIKSKTITRINGDTIWFDDKHIIVTADTVDKLFINPYICLQYYYIEEIKNPLQIISIE